MKMRAGLLFCSLLLMCAFLISGCKDDEAGPGICHLAKVLTDGNLTEETVYDADWLVTRRNYHDSTGQLSAFDLLSYRPAGGADSIFSYDAESGSLLSRTGITYYSVNSQPAGFRKLLFDPVTGEEQPAHTSSFSYHPAHEIYIEQQYIEGRGMIREIYFDYQNLNQISATSYDYTTNLMVLEGTVNYIFDDKRNPRFQWEMPFANSLYLSRNMIRGREVLNHSNNPVPEQTYSSTFEYNAHNYPVKETRTYLSGRVQQLEYQYTCQ